MKRFFVITTFSLVAMVISSLGPPRLEADGRVPGLLAALNGDVDADGMRDLNDAVYLLNFIFRGTQPPRMLACEPAAEIHNGDVNASGLIDVSDPIYLLNWLFLGEAPPIEGCPLPGL